MVLVVGLALAGCGPPWVYTYTEAENLAKPYERPIFVIYRDHLDVKSSNTLELVESPAIASLLDGFVSCSLVSAYPPNRKYIAQYGVAATPAIVIVHPDGTYHALVDRFDADSIRAFITNSKPPGAKPTVDIEVARPPDFLYRAEGVFEKALDKAQRQNRKLLIVYKWWLDGNSTELIGRMTRPEVANRCTETVNCVLDWDYIPNRAHVGKYGVDRFPALIVVHPNGSHQKQVGLAEVSEIVGFLERSLGGGRRQERPRAATGSDWRWFAYHDRALAQARQQQQGLFVFCHSVLEEESARMMRLLDTQTLTQMFHGTVNCSLAWSDLRNREVMRRYGVTATPAFIAVKPDGSYLVRQGVLSVPDLRQVRDFLPR